MVNKEKRLLEEIKKSGFSYPQLEEITKIPKSAIQRYATGETKKIPSDRLNKLANIFNVSTDYLLGLSDDKYDFEHMHTLNEIVYKQLQTLVDIDDYHKFDERLFNFMEAVKDGSFPIMEGSIDAIANLFDTNTLYLLGKIDNWDSEDPMDDEFEVRIKKETSKLLKNPNKLVEEYNNRKREEYQKILVNRAYNTLSDLDIKKIKGQFIMSIEPKLLIGYYNIIIKYIKSTTKMVDFDKLIDENNKMDTKENVTNTDDSFNNYVDFYYDIFTYKEADTIDKINNAYQFENYIAFILRQLNFEISVVSKSISNNVMIYPDFHAFKDNNEYYIECKYLNDSSKISMNIKKWSFMLETINTKKKVTKVLVTNIILNANDRMICKNYFDELWDYNYLKSIEK